VEMVSAARRRRERETYPTQTVPDRCDVEYTMFVCVTCPWPPGLTVTVTRPPPPLAHTVDGAGLLHATLVSLSTRLVPRRGAYMVVVTVRNAVRPLVSTNIRKRREAAKNTHQLRSRSPAERS
jgi:hypothetical protein